jgi:hypothetical protein
VNVPNAESGVTTNRDSVRLLVAVAALLVGVVSLLNYFVDPFGRFGMNTVGYFYSSERDIAYGSIRSLQFDGIVLGSSKATEIAPPLVRGSRLLNTAWSAALPEEMSYFLRDRFPSTRDDEYVAIGLDLFMFNEGAFAFVEESEFDPWRLNHTLSLLASWQMAWRSIDAIHRARSGVEPFALRGGERNTVRLEPEDLDREPNYRSTLETLRTDLYADFDFSERRADALSAIGSWGEETCTPIVVFISPLHPVVRRLQQEMALAREWESFVGAVFESFPNAIDLSESEWSQPDDFWTGDPFHYLPSTGADLFGRAILPAARERSRELPKHCRERL